MAMIGFNTSTNTGDYTLFNEGVTVFTLEGIHIKVATEFEAPYDPYPAATLVWVDPEGDKFYDSFVKVPIGLKLNDKAKWTKRLGALVGRPLKDDDVSKLGIDFGDDISNYDQLFEAVKAGRTVEVLALEFEGQSLFGRQAQLNLTVTQDGKWNRCAAGDATPMPRAGGGKTRPGAVGAPI